MLNRFLASTVAAFLLSFSAWAQLPPPAADVTYVTRPGDTMIGIARRYLAEGEKAQVQRALQQHNGFPTQREADRIPPGLTVRIPTNWLRSDASRIEITSTGGEASIRGTPVAVGMQVRAGDEVRTGTSGQVTIKLADGSTLAVKPGSTLTVDRAAGSPLETAPDAVFSLKSGKVEAEVPKRTTGTSRFEVRTPIAVAAVRGTRFRVSADPAGTFMTSEVLDGSVAVADTGGRGTVSVNADFGTRTNAGEAPAEPRTLLPAPRLWGGTWLAARRPAEMRIVPLPGARAYRVIVASGSASGAVAADITFDRNEIVLPDLPNGDYYVSVRGLDNFGLEGRESGSALRVQLPPVPAVKPPAGDPEAPQAPAVRQ